MGSCSRKKEDEIFLINSIDKKPIRLDVTFTVSDPISGQGVVVILVRERFTKRKMSDDLLQKRNFKMTLHGEFIVAFELRGRLDDIFCLFHFFKSANSSSRSV